MTRDKLAAYRKADQLLPERNRFWPLYGAGFDNLGREGQPIEVPMPEVGPDELLVRHDACGLCFSDIKVIRLGEEHPRIYRKMRSEPVILGHEVCMTVVGVGQNLCSEYHVGDRFIMQADIYVDGVGYAYGYEIQGGLSQYNVIDGRVLAGDDGNYLIPLPPSIGYAGAALTEPWACVEASYNVAYRTRWQAGGCVLIVGDGHGVRLGRARDWRPGKVVLNTTDAEFAASVRAWARSADIEIAEADDELHYDDIVVLSADVSLVEQVAGRLARGGILNIVTASPLAQPVAVDVGRLHYDHQVIVGSPGPDLSAAYAPVRSQLKPGGRLWVVGAAGPMGHMHIQRALERHDGPTLIVATNLRQPRIHEVERRFNAPAQAKGIVLVCMSHEAIGRAALAAQLQRQASDQGFDDVVVLAPSASAIEEAMPHLGDGGVMNIFAGLPRGTHAALDLNAVVRRGVRFTGSSGSSIEDLRYMRDLAASHVLSPDRSVAAIGSLGAAKDGLQAVADAVYPGKVVIYPHIVDLPLTALPDLKDVLSTVHARLRNGHEWTLEAEEELLRLMLP